MPETTPDNRGDGVSDSRGNIDTAELARMEMVLGAHEGGWTGLYLVADPRDAYVGKVEADDVNDATAQGIAHRLQACWNFCEGMPTERIEAFAEQMRRGEDVDPIATVQRERTRKTK